MIATIARHELRRLFLSPLAWSVLAILQLVLAYIFLINIDRFIARQAELALLPQAPGATLLVAVQLVASIPILLLVVAPLISMRLLSDERRLQTRVLLLSAPLRMYQIVLGKYLALVLFFTLLWVLQALMLLSLGLGTGLDLGHIASALLAFYLLILVVTAVGIYMSSLTSQPAIAAMASFGLLMLLWIVDSGAQVEQADSLLTHLSMSHHYQSLLTGVVGVVDVGYFLLVSGLFIVLTVARLHRERVYA